MISKAKGADDAAPENNDAPESDNLDYEGFRALARQSELSKYERIGFPDAYRAVGKTGNHGLLRSPDDGEYLAGRGGFESQ